MISATIFIPPAPFVKVTTPSTLFPFVRCRTAIALLGSSAKAAMGRSENDAADSRLSPNRQNVFVFMPINYYRTRERQVAGISRKDVLSLNCQSFATRRGRAPNWPVEDTSTALSARGRHSINVSDTRESLCSCCAYSNRLDSASTPIAAGIDVVIVDGGITTS